MHDLKLNSFRTRIIRDKILALPGGRKCNLDVETGPDGALYFIQGGGYVNGDLYRLVP